MIVSYKHANFAAASPLARDRLFAEIGDMKIPHISAFAARFAALVLLAWLAVHPSHAAEVKAAALDEAARADIARIESYLNGITTMRTRFLQVSQNGETATGVLTMARPGRMRFEYDPPTPIMLIADGTFLIYIDRSLGQTTHVFLRNTPVGVLVAENIKLSGTVTITRFVRGPGVLRVTLVKTNEPEEGAITLVFSDGPLALRQWMVVDSQGAQTTVTLDDLEYGVAVTREMFNYEKPQEIPRD
jgi:outer membrane lipoprotein-sorting protein